MPVDLPAFSSGWHCYLLLCSDRSFYCGITENLSQRLRDHASGKGAKHTRGAKPIALVWFDEHADQRSAAQREREIKKWGRKKKEALAATGVWVSLVATGRDSG